MLLKIENLTFGWQNQLLFENICVELDRGKIIQLVGENGSGKTTLLHLISGMIPHFNRGEILKGEIFVNGHSMIQDPPKCIFSTIALIPSIHIDFFLLTENFSQEILLTRSIMNISEDQALRRLEEFSDFLPDIHQFMTVPAEQMTFNQKVLALSFIFYLQHAQLYLFDEVFAQFSNKQLEMWYSLFNWLCIKGCGIIFVSHQGQGQNFLKWQLKDKKLNIL